MLAWLIIFYCSLFLICYTYIGYGILLYIIIRIKRLFSRRRETDLAAYEPDVTLLVTAYNEELFIAEKIRNTLQLDYPENKLHILFVTDGSNDDTNSIIGLHPRIQLLYQPDRRGKTAALNRAMAQVRTPLVICCDANTLLNKEAVRFLVRHFVDPQTGAVAGEKRILTDGGTGAEVLGEGMYWKYESLLKKWDAELYSVMGAAGELFAIRHELYQAVPEDTVLDDFMISFGINMKGYKVMYEPQAYAAESASASMVDEHKRKVRISAGGFQAIVRLLPLFNFFRYPRITWQYVSHRVLRWTLAPLCLPLLLISSIILVTMGAGIFYITVLAAQLLFYAAAIAGRALAARQKKNKWLYIAFYFVFMNISVFQGFWRFIRRQQSAAWEKSARTVATASK